MTKPQTTDWVREAIDQAHAEIAAVPTTRALAIQAMIADVAAGIMVLHDRDNVPVTKDMSIERARNIVGGLIHTYKFQELT
jgi:hypothetical protein